jgi:hypothetical protein
MSMLGPKVTQGFAGGVQKMLPGIREALGRMASSGGVPAQRGVYRPVIKKESLGGSRRQDWVYTAREQMVGESVSPDAELVFRRMRNGQYKGYFVEDGKKVPDSPVLEWPKELTASGARPLPHVNYRAKKVVELDKQGVLTQKIVSNPIRLSDYSSRKQKSILNAMSENVEKNFARILVAASRGDEQAIAALNWYPLVGRNLDETVVQGLKGLGWSDDEALSYATSIFSGASPRTTVRENARAVGELLSGTYEGMSSPVNVDVNLGIFSGLRRGPGLWKGSRSLKTDYFDADVLSGAQASRLLPEGLDLSRSSIADHVRKLMSSGQIDSTKAGTVDMWAEELLVGIDPGNVGTLLDLGDKQTYEAARQVFQNIGNKYELPTWMVQSGTWDSKAKVMLRSRPPTDLSKLLDQPFVPDSLLRLSPGEERTAGYLLRVATQGTPQEREMVKNVLGKYGNIEGMGRQYKTPERLTDVQDMLGSATGYQLGVAAAPIAGGAAAVRNREQPGMFSLANGRAQQRPGSVFEMLNGGLA